MVYASAMNIVKSDLTLIKKTNIPRQLNKINSLIENALTGCTVALNNQMMQILKINKCPKNIVMHDAWVYLTAAFLGGIYYDASSYIMYRQHAGNVVGYKNNFTKRILMALKNRRIKKEAKNNFFKQSIEFYNKYEMHLKSEDKKLCEEYIRSLRNSGLEGVRFIMRKKFISNGGIMITLMILFKTMIGYGV
jgi:rhamnosyltransferase